MQIYPICSSFQPKFVPILLQAEWMDQSFVLFPVLRTKCEIDKIRSWKFALENIDLNVEPRYVRYQIFPKQMDGIDTGALLQQPTFAKVYGYELKV